MIRQYHHIEIIQKKYKTSEKNKKIESERADST